MRECELFTVNFQTRSHAAFQTNTNSSSYIDWTVWQYHVYISRNEWITINTCTHIYIHIHIHVQKISCFIHMYTQHIVRQSMINRMYCWFVAAYRRLPSIELCIRIWIQAVTRFVLVCAKRTSTCFNMYVCIVLCVLKCVCIHMRYIHECISVHWSGFILIAAIA